MGVDGSGQLRPGGETRCGGARGVSVERSRRGRLRHPPSSVKAGIDGASLTDTLIFGHVSGGLGEGDRARVFIEVGAFPVNEFRSEQASLFKKALNMLPRQTSQQPRALCSTTTRKGAQGEPFGLLNDSKC